MCVGGATSSMTTKQRPRAGRRERDGGREEERGGKKEGAGEGEIKMLQCVVFTFLVHFYSSIGKKRGRERKRNQGVKEGK